MEPPPPFPPPLTLPAALAHLRSLLSAASSTLAALPSPLLPNSTATATTTLTATVPSPPPATTPVPPLPPPASAVLLPLPLPAVPPHYSDCPAVVHTTLTPIPASCSLPAFLAAQCAEYSSSSSTPAPAPSPPRTRILPSVLGLLRRELDSWAAVGGVYNHPVSYSYAVTRVAAALGVGEPPQWEAELRRLVVVTSRRHGVTIDAELRDHVWVLVRLCLKAIAAEAGCSLDLMGGGKDHEGSHFDPRGLRFECPRLAEGVSWLGAQLGVLYGEGSGRLFAAAAVKEAILRMGCCLAVGVGDDSVCGGGEGGAGGCAGEKGSDVGDVVAGPVFLNQVAAAIAALHKRFSLKEETKALQTQRQPKHQLLLEYSQALERGHLERSNRPNYRAVLEYDGILSHRVENQDSGRAKTREELLAEERDYKRRRASYRGKKVKRNPTEILRDIIDEHMEEIKQAGGVGYLLEAPSDITQNMLKNNSHGGTCQESFDLASISSYDKEVLGSRSPSCENSAHAASLGKLSSRNRNTRDSYKSSRHGTHRSRYQNVFDDENSWSKGSESEIDQSYPHQQESNRRQRNSNDNRKYGYKYKNDVSDHRPESSDYTTWSTRSQRSSVTEFDHMSGGRSDRSRTSQKRHRSLSVIQDQFSDRYDPQSTYCDGDPLTSMLCDVTEGKCNEVHCRGHRGRKRGHHR